MAKTGAKKSKRVYPLDPDLRLSVQFGKGVDPMHWPLSAPRMRRMVLAALSTRCATAELTVMIVGQAEGRRLNAAYRHKDYATNVLTFDYTLPPAVLADLVICLPVVSKEARSQKKAIDHHAAHLLIHGSLHACGLDHLNDQEAEQMEALEVAILRRFRIANPYSV